VSYEEGRYGVVRNAFDYAVVDKQEHEWVALFGGKTGRSQAWRRARKLNKENASA
jgi:hypothetical protein